MRKGYIYPYLSVATLSRVLCLVSIFWVSLAIGEPQEFVFVPGSADAAGTYSPLLAVVAVFFLLGSAVAIKVIERLKAAKKDTEVELKSVKDSLQEAQAIAQLGSWSRDFEHGTSFWSKEARAVLELGDDHEAFKHYETLVHPDDVDGLMEAVAIAYHKGGGYIHEHRVISPTNKTEKWIRLAGRVFMGEEEAPVRETGTVQDVTLRRQAEFALKQSEEKLRSILEAAPYPIMIFGASDVPTLLYANKSTYYLFEIDGEVQSLESIEFQSFWVNEESKESFIQASLNEDQSNHEALMKTQKGKAFWGMLSSTSMDFQGEPALFVSVLDVTDRKLIQEELERLATTDPLTGLLNRRSLFDIANKEIRRAIRYKQSFTLLMLDIDHFKRVNDTYGHAAGDLVIKSFSEVCAECLREEDSLGRVGGEEFVAVLVSSNAEGGRVVAERMRSLWESKIIDMGGIQEHLTVSIGVSELLSAGETVDIVMERADKALYVSKSSGRNCVTLNNDIAEPNGE